MGLGLAALGDVGEGLHEAAVRQVAAANLDDVAVRHLALADRDLSRLAGVAAAADRPEHRGIARFAACDSDELVEARRVVR